jgi:hypothetical protein
MCHFGKYTSLAVQFFLSILVASKSGKSQAKEEFGGPVLKSEESIEFERGKQL